MCSSAAITHVLGRGVWEFEERLLDAHRWELSEDHFWRRPLWFCQSNRVVDSNDCEAGAPGGAGNSEAVFKVCQNPHTASWLTRSPPRASLWLELPSKSYTQVQQPQSKEHTPSVAYFFAERVKLDKVAVRKAKKFGLLPEDY